MAIDLEEELLSGQRPLTKERTQLTLIGPPTPRDMRVRDTDAAIQDSLTGVGTLLGATGPMLILEDIGLLGLYALILVLLGELTREDLQPLMLWRSGRVSEALFDP
jgi:hypothetical protein